jgi:AcrR family transcriptional regulator
MTQDQFSSPTRRADAERNRDKILAVARAAFADPAEGEVSMAEISRRAGVGMATLYRNFPGRRELLEALFIDEVNAVCEAAQTAQTAQAAGNGAPGAVFTTWLRRFFAFITSKRHIAAELLEHTDSGDPIFGNNRARVHAAARPLFAAAQEAGEIRDDLTLEQALDMIIAIATVRADARYIEPILQAALDGLRPPADRPADKPADKPADSDAEGSPQHG